MSARNKVPETFIFILDSAVIAIIDLLNPAIYLSCSWASDRPPRILGWDPGEGAPVLGPSGPGTTCPLGPEEVVFSHGSRQQSPGLDLWEPWQQLLRKVE
jgi:hypothetical protein